MGMNDNEEIAQMVEALSTGMVRMMGQMAEPIGNLIRATTNATVDALIDNRQRMLENNFSPELADMVCITIINRNADVAKKVAEAITEGQKRANKT